MRPPVATLPQWGAIAVLVAAALLPGDAGGRREWSLFGSTRTFRVVSGADTGPGTLRQALIDAARAGHFARINVLVSRLTVDSPMPPALNPIGLEIVASGDSEVDARQLPSGAVLDILTPHTLVRGLKITGAADAGIRVRTGQVRLENVRLRSSLVGVDVVGDAAELSVRASDFEDNATGLRIVGAARAEVHDSHFRSHGEAGIWSVAPVAGVLVGDPRLQLSGCTFHSDHIGVVALNASVAIVESRFEAAGEAALLVNGPARVSRIRVSGNTSYGVLIEPGANVSVESSEIDNNAVGLRVAEGRAIRVHRNAIHGNVFGVVSLFGGGPAVELSENTVSAQRADAFYVLGSSPLITANQILANMGAALRLVDYVPARGREIASRPILEGNTVSGNGSNEPVRDRWAAPRTAAP